MSPCWQLGAWVPLPAPKSALGTRLHRVSCWQVCPTREGPGAGTCGRPGGLMLQVLGGGGADAAGARGQGPRGPPATCHSAVASRALPP